MLCRSLLHPIRTEVIVIGRRDRESLQYRNKKADSELYITTLFKIDDKMQHRTNLSPYN